MRKTRTTLAAGLVAVVVGGGGAAVVAVNAGDDAETPITGAALERAGAAALAHTGQGRITGTEVGDEDSYYEVEITLDDGSQVDVQLDEQFRVVDATADVEDDEGDSGQD